MFLGAEGEVRDQHVLQPERSAERTLREMEAEKPSCWVR